jgi:hypothetical protein
MKSISSAQLDTWRVRVARNDPFDLKRVAEEVRSQAGRPVGHLREMLDLPIYPERSVTDEDILSVGAELAVVRALAKATDGDRLVRLAMREDMWLVRRLTPVFLPFNYTEIAVMARDVTDSMPAYELREVVRARLEEKIRPAIETRFPGRSGEGLAAEIHSALDKRGALRALDEIWWLVDFVVAVRQTSQEGVGALASTFERDASERLRAVTRSDLLTSEFPYRYNHRGLQSEVVFGPIADGTCSCGYYQNWGEEVECHRCGVTTADSSVRLTRGGAIDLVTPVVHPVFGGWVHRVEVVPAGLRALAVHGGHIEIDSLDLEYQRLLTINDLAQTQRDNALSTGTTQVLAQRVIDDLFTCSRGAALVGAAVH